MAYIYKICPRALWQEAERAGTFTGAPVDLADGFIHFSTAAQVAETAERHFKGQGDLVLVAVDADRLGSALRFEPSRGGGLFPHLYGALALDAVTSVRPLPLDAAGAHLFPSDLTGSIPSDPAGAGWTRMETDRFIGLVGPLWTKADGPDQRYGFLAEERHLNRGGVVHGGMVMTFADQALGLAAWRINGDLPQVTVQLDTHFVSGVSEGEFVEARCRVVRTTRSMMFMAAELTVGDRIVAIANGLWRIRGSGPPAASDAGR